MAKSRYAATVVIDGASYGTWRNRALEQSIDHDMLDGVETIEHVVIRGERLDHLAARYLGEEQYYWVIALVNAINDPLVLVPGRKLRIPTDVKQVLDKLM